MRLGRGKKSESHHSLWVGGGEEGVHYKIDLGELSCWVCELVVVGRGRKGYIVVLWGWLGAQAHQTGT